VDVSKLKIEEAKKIMAEHDFSIDRVIVHAPYIINLANALKPETALFGQEFLKTELERVSKIGAKTLVLHPGSHVGAGMDIGIEWIINGLNEVLDHDTSDVKIALETMAGKGNECGFTFEQLQKIYLGIHKKSRIGFCMDTCHIWDAGYDITHFDEVLNQFDSILGLENLLCMHINDSKNDLGAHKDRHENIGKGYIGFDVLYAIVHHPKLEHVTKILETPFVGGKACYKEEISALR
jgi:deoxyribonuclease-4